MKRTLHFIITILAGAALAFSCGKAAPQPEPEPQPQPEPEPVVTTIDFTLERSALKSDFNNGSPIWTDGDVIEITDGENRESITLTDHDIDNSGMVASVTTRTLKTDKGTKYYAVYPSSAYGGVTNGTIRVSVGELPVRYSSDALKAYAVTDSESKSFKFNDIEATIYFETENADKIKYVRINALGSTLTASMDIDTSVDPAVVKVTDSHKSAFVDYYLEGKGKAFVPVCAGSAIPELTVTAFDKNGDALGSFSPANRPSSFTNGKVFRIENFDEEIFKVDPTTDPDPTPEPPGTDPTSQTSKGWFELPVMGTSDSNLYYSSHSFTMGGKVYRNYTVCFGGKQHCPFWVAAPRHAVYEAGSGRHDSYQPDPNIPANLQYYSKSTGGGCNKGHMLGSAERTCIADCNKQVFYYSNIAPQLSSTFNTGGGAWNNLEDRVDTYVCSDTLYVVIGCYFESYTDAYGKTCEPKTISFGGRDDVAFPTMFYYALLRTKKGDSGKAVTKCSADELKCTAFVIRHNMEKGHKPQAQDMMSVSDLEKITGFTYFTNVPNAPKGTCTPSDWGITSK